MQIGFGLNEIVKLLRLGGIRIFALFLAFLANLVVIKLLTLEEVGKYYLLVTVSYVGNALIFVGADLLLQKRIQPSIEQRNINFPSLFLYIVCSSFLGLILMLALSFIYFTVLYRDGLGFLEGAWYTLVCCLGSVALYVSSLTRNLFLLGNDALLSNLQLMFDGLIKLTLILLGFFFLNINDGLQYFIIISLGAGVAGLIGVSVLGRCYSGTGASLAFGVADVIPHILPVGGAGLLNLAQLQGYRLYLTKTGDFFVLGCISFLLSLGTTATNAVLSLIGQFYIPKIYSAPGLYVAKYLFALFLCAIFLAIFSWPAAELLIFLLGKEQLVPFVWIVPIGVAIEFGNALIGAMTHHLNSEAKRLHPVLLATLFGASVSVLTLFIGYDQLGAAISVACALLFGQFVAIAYILVSCNWGAHVKR